MSSLQWIDALPRTCLCAALLSQFSAPSGQAYLPFWLMQNLLLREGGKLQLHTLKPPPAATFVRFQPLCSDFLTVAALQGPRALMEHALRQYCALSEGEIIAVRHGDARYSLKVVEVRPSSSSNSSSTGCSVVSLAGDLDLEVDFALPPGGLTGPALKPAMPAKQTQQQAVLTEASNVYLLCTPSIV
jgi:ubiquitin fusion degradation protein 1